MEEETPEIKPEPIPYQEEDALTDKAIDIKGKKYVMVSDRIIQFNKRYPEGCIVTDLVDRIEDEDKKGAMLIMRATIYPHGRGTNARIFSGYAQERIGEGFINKTSALENCETSAVGRALAMMGIGVIDAVASVDEINKAEGQAKSHPTIGNDPKKICVTCKEEFTPNEKAPWATDCFKCWKNKQDGAQPAPANYQPEPTMDDIPFE